MTSETLSEIVREIVKWNAANTKVLCTYSLISKTWRDATLPFIFEEAGITTTSLLVRWSNLVKSSPEIRRHFRRVCFMFGNEGIEDQGPLSLLASLPTLPAVTELEWCLFENVTRMTKNMVQFLEAFPNVRTVNLSTCFADMTHLKGFLGCFVYLKELGLWEGLELETDSGEDSEGVDTSRFNLSQLERLEVFSDTGSTAFDWFIDTLIHDSKLTCLSSLEVQTEGFTLSGLIRLLEVFSSTLKHFAIDPVFDTADDEPFLRPLPVSFPPLPTLNKLTIATIDLDTSFGADFAHAKPSHVIRWVRNLIRAITAPKLEIFEWHFRASTPAEIEDAFESCSWKNFTAALADKCPKIKQINFQFETESDFGMATRVQLEGLVRKRIVVEEISVTMCWKIDFPDFENDSADMDSEEFESDDSE
ncbi:hypothetical protein WG66_002257 [Moniliophthora roreri]|nr:hypothetical protein WG66_002257 [Moniliophthora roreri]